MERLISLVQDEQACVTVKRLAYELQIPSNKSKMLLNALVAKGDTANLAVTYFISGIANNMIHLKLVNGAAALEAEKKRLDQITAMHVYAVEQTKATEGISTQTLWNTDQQKLQEEALQSSTEEEAAFQRNNAKPVPINSRKSTFGKSGNGSKNKSSITPKEFFASKSTGENVSKKPSKKGKTAKAFFGNKKKGSAATKTKEKKQSPAAKSAVRNDDAVKEVEEDVAKRVPKRARNVIDSDSEAEELDDSEEREFGEPLPKRKRSSKKQKVEMTDEERVQKEAERKEQARKRRQQKREEIEREKADRRKEEAEEAKSRFAESLGCSQQNKEKNAKRTKLVKKLVEKQYVDEKGYLVSEEVMEEVEVAIESNEDDKRAEREKKSKGASEESSKQSGKKISNSKKASTKQANIHSFFKKKK